jgi:hypothetical protein
MRETTIQRIRVQARCALAREASLDAAILGPVELPSHRTQCCASRNYLASLLGLLLLQLIELRFRFVEELRVLLVLLHDPLYERLAVAWSRIVLRVAKLDVFLHIEYSPYA